LMVLETGELEPLTQGPTLDLLNLASENEMLQDGQSIPVLFTDNHVLHIQEHSSIASDPIVRSNPEQFGIIAKHIMEHIQMLSDPDYQNYRMLTNQPSIAPVGAQPGATMPPGTPQAGAPGPAATSLNASGGPTSTNPPSGPNPTNVQQMAGNVKQPQMPVNPLSGKREML
jgi:hypothetical protein